LNAPPGRRGEESDIAQFHLSSFLLIRKPTAHRETKEGEGRKGESPDYILDRVVVRRERI